MEVHAHSHTERKKFTHYLWEFLMLFLAVFCGFLAENQREHMVEHQREKEYMRSFVEDLQTDTSNLNSEILFGQTISDHIEKLVSLLYNNDPFPKDSIEKLYLYNLNAGRVVKVDFEDRTSSQLKNAGNMRLIRNKLVADSIRNYWGITKVIDGISDRLESLGSKTADVAAKLFYTKYILFTNIRKPLESDFTILSGAKLIDNDPKLLKEYANRRHSTRVVLNNYIVFMKKAKNTAENLIGLIKKEYHLQ